MGVGGTEPLEIIESYDITTLSPIDRWTKTDSRDGGGGGEREMLHLIDLRNTVCTHLCIESESMRIRKLSSSASPPTSESD